MVELAAGEPQAEALEQVGVRPHQPDQVEVRAETPLLTLAAALVVAQAAEPVAAPEAAEVAVEAEAGAEGAVEDHPLSYPANTAYQRMLE